MKSTKTQFVTRTAILLALCVVLQLALPTSIQAIKGPAVNIVLLLAAYTVGVSGACIVAVINPIFVFFLAAPAAMKLCPQIVFVVMLGNAVFVVCAALLKKPLLGIPGLVAACLCKTGVMMLATSYLVLPYFGAAVEAAGITAVVEASFGIAQLSTAAMGSAIFFVIWQLLQKVPVFAKKGA